MSTTTIDSNISCDRSTHFTVLLTLCYTLYKRVYTTSHNTLSVLQDASEHLQTSRIGSSLGTRKSKG